MLRSGHVRERGRPPGAPRIPRPKELTLLKRADPDVFVGTPSGAVFCMTVLPGGDFDENYFRQPERVTKPPIARFETGGLRELGLIASNVEPAWLRAPSGVVLKEYVHPAMKTSCVAGYDPKHRRWFVEA